MFILLFFKSFNDVVEFEIKMRGKKKKNNINEDKELVRFYYEDIRNIDEINKISEYKILPIKY